MEVWRRKWGREGSDRRSATALPMTPLCSLSHRRRPCPDSPEHR